MKAIRICFVLLGLLQGVNGAAAQAAQDISGANLLQILTNRSLWGPTFGSALSRIPAWNQIGESTVVVFNDRVMGNAAYETREQANAAAANLERAITSPPRQAVPAAHELLAAAQAVPFHPEIMPYADDFLHVYLVDSQIQILSRNLTPAGIEEQLAKPERVSKLAIEGKGDRRGVVLTLFAYAGGKVVFAQADVSARPSTIDRVFLDVPAVMAALFQVPK
jgi:hypothetical protein